MAAAHLVCALAVAIGLAGCHVHNTQTGLIGEESLNALGQSWPNDVPASTPSAATLDRGHWQPIVVRVPLQQVEHFPTYVTAINAGEGLRAAGEYPRGASIADEQALRAAGDVCAEARAIVSAAVDLVISPVRAVVVPPCSTVRSSDRWYEPLPRLEAYAISAWLAVKPTPIDDLATPLNPEPTEHNP